MLKVDFDGTYKVDINELLQSVFCEDLFETLQQKAIELLKRDGVAPLGEEGYLQNQIDMMIGYHLPEGRDLYDEIAFFLARYANTSMENSIEE